VATRAALVAAFLLSIVGRVAAQTEGGAEVRLELHRIEALERAGQLTEAATALEELLRRMGHL